MFLTTDTNEKLFIIPQLILYFKENKPGRNNTYYSMHQDAKTVIAYTQGEVFYVKETFDTITQMMLGDKPQQ